MLDNDELNANKGNDRLYSQQYDILDGELLATLIGVEANTLGLWDFANLVTITLRSLPCNMREGIVAILNLNEQHG